MRKVSSTMCWSACQMVEPQPILSVILCAGNWAHGSRARWTDCAAELKATRQFHATLSKHAVEEPSPNVLTSSRMRLQEALETAEQGGWWQRFIFEPAAWLRQIQFSPALAAVIFIIGFAGGIGATYKMIKGTQPEIAREVPTPATE